MLHSWHISGSASPLRLEILTGTAGGHFYVDAVEMFVDRMPWYQVGYDRSYMLRTGGRSVGGDPDEYHQVALHVLVP